MSVAIALGLGLHNLTTQEWSDYMRGRVEACFKRSFTDLVTGTYIYKNGNRSDLLTVDRVMPQRTQAIVRVNNHTKRVYKTAYPGVFYELDTELHSLVTVQHEEIIKAAVNQGIDVTPKVRREYPHLFVMIPERFAQAQCTAAERVTRALNETWVRRDHPLCAADLEAQIEEAHKQIAVLQDTRVQAV